MGQKIYDETSIQSIANAIREKTKTNTKYTVADMPSGINEVYEAGKSAKNDNFWEQYQAGRR